MPGQTPFLTECGTFGGWWTADDLCGAVNVALSNVGPIGCVDDISQGHDYLPSTTMQNLFGWVSTYPVSCYTSGATQSCCGCATDPNNLDYQGTQLSDFWPSDVTGEPNGECASSNDVWVDQIQPWLANLKEACPTAYTYPYDDKTSTFQCQNGTSNTMPYKVTIGDLPTPAPAPTP